MRRIGVWMVVLLLVAVSVPAGATRGNGQPGPTYAQRASALLAQNPDLPYSPIGVLVRFHPAASESARGQARAAIGGRLETRYQLVPGLELIETEIGVGRALSILGRLPFVEYAEPDYIVELAEAPNDPYFSLLWGLDNTGQTLNLGRGNKDPGTAGADIGVVEAWSIFTGDPGFVVAVVDTGVDYTHPDLAANIWTNPGEIAGNGVDDDENGYIDDVQGWDFLDNDNDPMDWTAHGTHVAGTIGAMGNNGIGVAGVNWQCQIMPLKAIPYAGPVSTAAAAIDYAVAMGAKVSNHSWGTPSFSQALYDVVAAAGQQGHLVVAAAHNWARDVDVEPCYPACFDLDNVISVAATDNDDLLAPFSNWGLLSVDLGGPGVNVYSSLPGDAYGYRSGTSMATPHVAGVAALVWSLHPEWTYLQVRDCLLTSVRPVASLQGRTVTGGVVSASAAFGVPNAPSGLTVDKSGTTALLNWQDNSLTEDGFDIEREKKSGRNWIDTTSFTAPADATSISDTPGRGTFRYRVRAWNALADSDWTEWVSVKM